MPLKTARWRWSRGGQPSIRRRDPSRPSNPSSLRVSCAVDDRDDRWRRRAVPEAGQRVGARRLPAVAEALREARFEARGSSSVPSRNPTFTRPHSGNGRLADVAERIVHARRRVVAQIDVVGVLFAAAARVNVVRLHIRDVARAAAACRSDAWWAYGALRARDG